MTKTNKELLHLIRCMFVVIVILTIGFLSNTIRLTNFVNDIDSKFNCYDEIETFNFDISPSVYGEQRVFVAFYDFNCDVGLDVEIYGDMFYVYNSFNVSKSCEFYRNISKCEFKEVQN